MPSKRSTTRPCSKQLGLKDDCLRSCTKLLAQHDRQRMLHALRHIVCRGEPSTMPSRRSTTRPFWFLKLLLAQSQLAPAQAPGVFTRCIILPAQASPSNNEKQAQIEACSSFSSSVSVLLAPQQGKCSQANAAEHTLMALPMSSRLRLLAADRWRSCQASQSMHRQQLALAASRPWMPHNKVDVDLLCSKAHLDGAANEQQAQVEGSEQEEVLRCVLAEIEPPVGLRAHCTVSALLGCC